MLNIKNIVLRITAFVLFVILPIYVVVKTPVLKQFYCSKTDNLCILRTYNTFDKEPSTDKSFKLSEISKVQKGHCKELFGLYTDPCIAIDVMDKTYVLDYSFSDDDTEKSIKDFNKYIKNPKENNYKLIADKPIEELNTQLACWGVLILMGLLISMGIIKDKKKNS